MSYSTVLLNCIREHPHGVVHRDYFLYGLLPVFAISEGGDKDQSLNILLLRGKSLSYQHPGRRCHQHECQAFNIQAFNFIWCSPACVATQRWIRMFLGVIVIVKFMLLWKATIHAFEAAKSFLLRNVFIIFRRRICSLGSARVLSVLLQPRGFTGRFGNLWSIAMNFLLLQVLHRWCRASLYSSQGYGCHRHHDVRYMPTSLFFKVDNNTPCKIFRWYTWFESWSTGGGGNSSRTLIFEIAYSLDACSAGGCATSY